MAGQFSEVGNFVARGAGKVNPALIDILKEAAARTGMQVEAYSGYRPGDPRFHGKGEATDIRIIGPDGNPLPNYQTPETFKTYEQLAQAARQVQMEKYPELADQFRWGGYFGGGKGKYGAMDLMHFDLGGGNGLGMAGGSWENGINPQQAALYGMKATKPETNALAYASPATSPAASAVNKLAQGAPVERVQSVNYVPPPFSGQGNFQPLFGTDQAPAQQAPQQTAPQPVERAPLVAPQQGDQGDDVLKAWGVDGSASQASPQAAPAQSSPGMDILKAWGVDTNTAVDPNTNQPFGIPAYTPPGVSGYDPKTGEVTPSAASHTGDTAAAFDLGAVNGVPIIGPALTSIVKGAASVAPALTSGTPIGQVYGDMTNRVNQLQQAHPTATTTGNITGAVAGMLPAVEAAPALFGASSTAGLPANMLMGGLSGAAVGGADSAVRSGGDMQATLQGAKLGGIFGALAPAAGKLVGAGVNKLVNWTTGTTPAARNVANVLSEIGMTPEDAKTALAKMGPDATLADLDPALTAEAGGLAAKGGAPTSILKGAMAERAAAADNRIAQTVESSLGARPDVTQAMDDIAAKASADAGPYYQAAGNEPLDASSVLNAIDKKLETANGSEKSILTKFRGYFEDPSAASVVEQSQKAAGDSLNNITDYMASTGASDPALDSARALLVKVQNGSLDKDAALSALGQLQTVDPTAEKLIAEAGNSLQSVTTVKTDPQALLKVRQAMDDDIQKAPISETTGGKNAERAANDVRGALDKVLKQNAGIQQGDAIYSAQMKRAASLEEGRLIFSPKVRMEDWDRAIASKTPEQLQSMRTGALASLWDALDNARNGDLNAIRSLLGKSTANRAKLESLFPNSADIFDKIANESAMRATEQTVAQNSATAGRQAILQKYAPKPGGPSGMAEVLAGEALGGGPGAVAGYLGRNALNSIRNSISDRALSALTEGTARGLSATGPEQQVFLNKLARAAASAKIGNSLVNGSNLATNLLIQGAGARYRNALQRQ